VRLAREKHDLDNGINDGLYKFKDQYICGECLELYFPSKESKRMWRSLEEVNYTDPNVRKVKSALARADIDSNDNEHERKIAQRQAEKMMEMYDFHKVVCSWCHK
jgi:hypothetical protein|tara:strand:+ start:100 stop:414 length:315 start_codon:yes stop_codon:yes gene_type:complete